MTIAGQKLLQMGYNVKCGQVEDPKGGQEDMRKTEVPAKKLSYEEFLEWYGKDTWAEWVDGEVIMLTPASESCGLFNCGPVDLC